jgi:hypothetical protein
MSRTILTTADSGGIDLRYPTPMDYMGFEWAAEHLAKEKRYNGATPDKEYSVAQHSVLCCDAAMEIYNDRLVAAYCLIHDVHEAALKDDTTPKKRAIAAEAADKLGVLADDVLKVFNAITDRHDEAIHIAAGLPWPMPEGMAEKVKSIDLLLFVTEWRDLMDGYVHPDWSPYVGIAPLQKPIAPWDWRSSKEAFLARCRRYLPAMMPVESAA